MKNSINNRLISITVKDHGAELCSLKRMSDEKEYVWKGDPKYWGKHAPLLFPIVGSLKDNTYQYEGKVYNLSRHGFGRDFDFTSIIGTVDYQLRYLLQSNEKTYEMYPFEFDLLITYQLNDFSVDITYEVKNKGNRTMFFSIGAHPAFNCPIEEGEQYLVWDDKVTLESYTLDENGLINGNKRRILENEKVLPLNYDLFDQDALIFENNTNKGITLKNGHTEESIRVSFEGFPYLGIWSPKAPFVCIEPWYGISDPSDSKGIIETKKGILELQASSTFKCTYRIEILV